MNQASYADHGDASSGAHRFERYQQILADFSRMVADSSDVSALLQLTAVQAARGLGIGHTKVLQHRPALGDLLTVAGLGWRPGVVGHATFGADPGSVPGQTLQTRQPLIIYDMGSEPDLRNSAVLREHGIISLLNVPIAVDGIVWGVLEVDSDTPRHFGQSDPLFLQTMANILGLSLHSRIALQRSRQEAVDAAGAVATQKTLLRELEHRFKNDFQLIQALLMAQGRNNANEGLRRNLRQVMDRVAAIGMAYDQLSPTGAGGIVELADYLRALCGSLSQRKEGIQVEVDLAPLRVPHERAVPLGLMVNELVTNALKHAYPEGAGGLVKVSFAIAPEGEGELSVRDDGIGMGPPREGSSGTDLVTRLVQQIGGQLEKTKQEAFTLRFMPEIVSAAIRPTRLFPKQICTLANDLVQASFGLRQDAVRISEWGQLPAAADVHLAFKLSSSSLGTNFAFAAASKALCLNAPSSSGGALTVTGNVCKRPMLGG